MEILISVSIALSGMLVGYLYADLKARRRLETSMDEKTKLLNENLAAFTQAYADFNNRSAELDSRLNNLEFRFNGYENKR